MARLKTFKQKNSVKKDTMGKIKHVRTEVDGIIFDSKMESDYYIKLKEDLAKGLIKDFQLQPEFLLQDKYIIVDGQVIEGSDPDFNKLKRKTKAETIRAIKYRGDYLVTLLDDTIVCRDTKGQSTTEFEMKKKLFMHKYPHIKLEVIIYNPKTETWDDFYEYNKQLRAEKRARKKAKEEANS